MSWNLNGGDTLYAYMYEDHKYVYKEIRILDVVHNEWFKQYIFDYDGKRMAFNFHKASWDRNVFCVDCLSKNTYVTTDTKYRYDIFAKDKKYLDKYLNGILENQLKYIRYQKEKLEKEESEVLELMFSK